MHVYLRDLHVRLRMEEVDGQGLVPADSDLVPMAFYADENEHPSFRALLPPETVEVLRSTLSDPVVLGVLAEEPEGEGGEVHAMVGLAIPVGEHPGLEEEGADELEPWQTSVAESEAWRGGDAEFEAERNAPKTALLAFAPLVRIERKFPHDFAEELADLLESAISGATRPVLEVRVEKMLGEL